MSYLHCTFFSHQYEVSKKVTFHVKEYKCKHCKKEFTTNANGKLIPLTPKFKEINSVLERIYLKKKQRIQAVV